MTDYAPGQQDGDIPERGWNEEPPADRRQLTPAEIEEWRRTCPHPEALGDNP